MGVGAVLVGRVIVIGLVGMDIRVYWKLFYLFAVPLLNWLRAQPLYAMQNDIKTNRRCQCNIENIRSENNQIFLIFLFSDSLEYINLIEIYLYWTIS